MKKLRNTDSAYIAGLIDADGTVTLARLHRNESRRAAVSISNTDKALLQFVLTKVGAGKVTRKRVGRPNHSPSYTYAIYNRQAVHLLAQVVPYLRTYKAIRASLIMRDYVALTPRNGKYSQELKSARHSFEEKVLSTKARSTPSEDRLADGS